MGHVYTKEKAVQHNVIQCQVVEAKGPASMHQRSQVSGRSDAQSQHQGFRGKAARERAPLLA